MFARFALQTQDAGILAVLSPRSEGKNTGRGRETGWEATLRALQVGWVGAGPFRSLTLVLLEMRLDRVDRQIGPAGPFHKISAVAHLPELDRLPEGFECFEAEVRADIKKAKPAIRQPDFKTVMVKRSY